jgi:hypothetical protein
MSSLQLAPGALFGRAAAGPGCVTEIRGGLRDDASAGEPVLRGSATILAALGFLDALYMLAYDEGLIVADALVALGATARLSDGRSTHGCGTAAPSVIGTVVGGGGLEMLPRAL